MTDTKRAEAAVEYKRSGMNCCQSVVAAYKDVLDIDNETLMNLTSGFGMGMGCMEATCGALCGAVITAGLMNKGIKPALISKPILKSFEEKSGTTICKVLKGIETGKVLCACDDCVKNAVLALEETTEKSSV